MCLHVSPAEFESKSSQLHAHSAPLRSTSYQPRRVDDRTLQCLDEIFLTPSGSASAIACARWILSRLPPIGRCLRPPYRPIFRPFMNLRQSYRPTDGTNL